MICAADRGRDGDEDHARHHKVQPCKQRHAAQLHAGAAHAENRGNDVDCGADAAEAGDEQRDGPVVSAVAGGKCTRGQRGVRPPAHVGSVACAVESASAEKTEVKKKSAEAP